MSAVLIKARRLGGTAFVLVNGQLGGRLCDSRNRRLARLHKSQSGGIIELLVRNWVIEMSGLELAGNDAYARATLPPT